jgi:uncharacterized protein YfdQ (DUF2303 family)
MSIQIEYRYAAPTGSTFISIDDWIATQSLQDQASYSAAQERQIALNNQLTADGFIISWAGSTMIVNEDQSSKFDSELKSIYRAYQLATGMIFEKIETPV